MREFLGQLGSLQWWLSVVVVGILINLLSAYLKGPTDSWFYYLFNWWKNRFETKKIAWMRSVDKIRQTPHDHPLIAISEVNMRIRSAHHLIVAAMSIGISVYTMNNSEPTAVSLAVVIVFSISASLAA